MTTRTLASRRDPFADFDALIRSAFEPITTTSLRRGFAPAAEAFRDGDDAVVRIELPGLDPSNDVRVELDQGRLVISGERRDERSESGDGRTLTEIRYGSFSRSFALPAHVGAEALSASYDAGVLTVRVAGAYAGRTPTRIAVASSTTGPTVATPEVAGSTGQSES